MNKSAQLSAAIALAATAGFATAGSLDIDRAYASELKADAGTRNVLNVGNASNIEVEVGVRFSYTYNTRSDDASMTLGDDDTTVGFSFSDVEVRVSGDVTENMHATLSFDFGPDDGVSGSGGVNLEDAYVDWSVNDDFTLRVGQFVPNFSDEARTSEFHTLGGYRAVSHEYLNTPSWSQGIEGWFGGDNWTGTIGFTDGFGTWNTAFNSSAEQDYSFHARFDFYSDSDKARFNDQTSWRGSADGWRIGAGIAFASMGSTNPSAATDTDVFYWNADASYEGDGWTVRGAAYGYSYDGGTGADFDDLGFMIGGSVFFNDQWELFGRWDCMILDDNGNGLIAAAADDTFNFVSIGTNYYFVPESHAAKLSFEVGISLDETALIGGGSFSGSSVTGVSPIGSGPGSSGFLGDVSGEDGELMFSGTLQWLF
ncbi:MAG: hypothetical protein KC996_02040 [Phycisphaerales bacterium]|nr:hypothetical protein [Phycisphaerales bacterium]